MVGLKKIGPRGFEEQVQAAGTVDGERHSKGKGPAALGSAPRSRSMRTTDSWPAYGASVSGVVSPLGRALFTAAPALGSTRS
jgi:hypothetical protein